MICELICYQMTFKECLCLFQDFPGGSDGEESACDAEDWVRSLSWEDLLEKEMAIHSSTIARKIPWTEEPGRL